MFCFHRSPRVRSPGVRRSLVDDRGVATLEGILVFAVLAGVLLGIMLLGQWSTRLQYAQMGARLLTFDAGSDSLAKFGRMGDQADTATFSSGTWDYYASGLPTGWLNTFFVLPNPRCSASVRGTQRGRLPKQGSPSLFEFSPASLGYHSGSTAACDPWADTTADVQSTFLGFTYWVAYHRGNPETLSFIPGIPYGQPEVLETILGRVGIPR